jgi:hypothetical protein
MNRHKGLEWAQVQAKLEANAEKLWSLSEIERTGGEPDVVGHDKKTDDGTKQRNVTSWPNTNGWQRGLRKTGSFARRSLPHARYA